MTLYTETVSKTACPLCKSTDAWVIGELDRHSKPLHTVLCQCCGLAWTDPIPTEKEMQLFYEKDYRKEYKGTYQPKKKHTYRAVKLAAKRLKSLRKFIPKQGEVLDFGCGGGEFLYLLTDQEYSACGIEPNEGYGSYARDQLGLPVEVTFIKDKLPSEKKYDAITMFHVLEHLQDPIAMIKLLGSHLNPGGRLIIEVPNLEAICHAPGSCFHRAHLFHFSAGTLARLANLCDLEFLTSWTSDLGSSISAVFEKNVEPVETISGKCANGKRIYKLLKKHSILMHYLSPLPYIRAFRKAVQYSNEWLQVKRAKGPKEALLIAVSEVNRVFL